MPRHADTAYIGLHCYRLNIHVPGQTTKRGITKRPAEPLGVSLLLLVFLAGYSPLYYEGLHPGLHIPGVRGRKMRLAEDLVVITIVGTPVGHTK